MITDSTSNTFKKRISEQKGRKNEEINETKEIDCLIPNPGSFSKLNIGKGSLFPSVFE